VGEVQAEEEGVEAGQVRNYVAALTGQAVISQRPTIRIQE
jgi:hypothetical protein